MGRALSPSATVAALLFSVAPASAVVIDTVPIGNAGNVVDTQVMNDGTTGYGSVAYNYRIGTYEVTNAQYAEFLNAKATSNPLGLYSTSMGAGRGGITRGGSSPSYSYEPIAGRGDMPVNYVSWYDAIRFANWLHNGQGNGDTEMGAYTLGSLNPDGTPVNGDNIARNPGAIWFLTSENEWYKAAYYDSTNGSYFDFPTSSNTIPISEPPPGGSNSANYGFFELGDVTRAGAYSGSKSPYGTFDQGGNVWEWNESSNRGIRGGSFYGTYSEMFAGGRHDDIPPDIEYDIFGFRVATVPEPSTLALAALGVVGLAFLARRRRMLGKCRLAS